MKQTSVEFLINEIPNTIRYALEEEGVIEQAKVMEKEQKIQAQLDVLYNALNSNNVKLSVEQTITELINGTILQRNIRR